VMVSDAVSSETTTTVTTNKKKTMTMWAGMM
jgi:hypothetical protein